MTTNNGDSVYDVLDHLGACQAAVYHYRGARMSEAQRLWDTCEQVYWMVWLIGRCAPADWTGGYQTLRLFMALWDEVRPEAKRSPEEVAFITTARAIPGGPDFLALVRALRDHLRAAGDDGGWRHSARVVLRAVLDDSDRKDRAIAAHVAIDSMLWNSTYTSAPTLCTIIRRVHPLAPNPYKENQP